MPDAGDNDSIKADILDLVTLLATLLASICPPIGDPAISGPSNRDESSANAARSGSRLGIA